MEFEKILGRVLRERRVWSWELGVRSVELGVGSVECGVWSAEWGVGSAECGVRSWECGVGNLDFALPTKNQILFPPVNWRQCKRQ
jgi:hypothetical protein